MKRKAPLLLTIWLLFCLGLTGCARAEKPPKEVQEVYTQYLEGMKEDSAIGASYCNFDMDPSLRESYEHLGYRVDSYRIKNWTKLSDQLWAVDVCMVDVMNPSGADGTQFVGQLDGIYWVFINAYLLPDELAEGIDLTPYYPEDAILPEDIIGVIEPG